MKTILPKQKRPFVTYGKNTQEAKLGNCVLRQNEIKSGDIINMQYSPSTGELNLTKLSEAIVDSEKYPLFHSLCCPFTNNTNIEQNSNKNVLVAVVGALFDSENFVLLTKRKKDLIAYPGAWVCPGGHVEIDEELETSLSREISEEVGISLKDLKIEKCYKYLLYEAAEMDEKKQEPKTQHITIFFAVKFQHKHSQIAIQMQEEEVEAYSWIELESLFNFKDQDSLCQIHYLNGDVKDEKIKLFHQIYDEEDKIDGIASGHQIALNYYYENIFKKEK